jgi:acetolactate synthase-1/2/3 large subunit
MRSVADVIVRHLLDAGVESLFGVPGGGSNLDLIAAAGRAGLRFVLTATENAAAIAAVAQAEVTGRPGACLTTLGPGVASVVNGVACASLDRAPILVFTDAPPASAAAFSHQRIDHRALLTPVTKRSATISPETVGEVMAEAIACAMAPPRGPVHIECPADALSSISQHGPQASQANGGARGFQANGGARAFQANGGARAFQANGGARAFQANGGARAFQANGGARAFEANEGARAFQASAAQGRASVLQPELVLPVTADDLLASARRPLLLVGLGACDAAAAAAVRTLCATHNLRALVTYKAKGVVPDRDPHFAGVLTNGTTERAAIEDADLLIGIGLDPVELLPRPWPYRQPMVNVTSYEVPCDHVPFAAQIVGGVASGVRRLATMLRPVADPDDCQVAGLDVFPASDGLAPDRVVQIVADALPDARVTVDAGAHMFPATLLWPVAEPRGMLISNGLSTMGFALPAAIGAALIDRGPAQTGHHRSRGPRVVALTGDGGLLMCAGELLTAARERLRVLVVVFNDSALSLIDIKQRQRDLPASGVSLGSVRWCALAQSMGIASRLATNEDELRDALAAVHDADGPSLIETVVDPRTYGEVLRAVRGA